MFLFWGGGLGFRGFCFGVTEFGSRVFGAGFRAQDFGCRVEGFRFRAEQFQAEGCRVSGFGMKSFESQVSGVGFRDSGFNLCLPEHAPHDEDDC